MTTRSNPSLDLKKIVLTFEEQCYDQNPACGVLMSCLDLLSG